MAMDNTVTITGNITRDPELRFTPGGSAVTTFGLAWNRRWQNRQTNETEEQTSFFDVTCWNTLAENVSESLVKGNRVVVNGRLEQRSWETQDGERRSKIEIIADEVSPSLRWASAEVIRNERRDSGSGGGNRYQNAGGRPQRNDSERNESGGWQQGSAQTPEYSIDEEPF
ncbi:MAG: single-stranded DNA-binding protein [Acidimicrobiia bacterium]|nr:single-stranded DNA-binding protein [Acidimicrobiia bacterium]MYC58039.1 single-stranded DNA-binding protein [Acidimicrobiia bacterium]MYI30788.1 single-stranded DNA-binding protein [Acidimicrobiia bacterium]